MVEAATYYNNNHQYLNNRYKHQLRKRRKQELRPYSIQTARSNDDLQDQGKNKNRNKKKAFEWHKISCTS